MELVITIIEKKMKFTPPKIVSSYFLVHVSKT